MGHHISVIVLPSDESGVALVDSFRFNISEDEADSAHVNDLERAISRVAREAFPSCEPLFEGREEIFRELREALALPPTR